MTDPSPAERAETVRRRKDRPPIPRESLEVDGVHHWIVYPSRSLRNLEARTGKTVGGILDEFMAMLDLDEEEAADPDRLRESLDTDQMRTMLRSFSATRTYELLYEGLEGGRLKGINAREYGPDVVDDIIDATGQAEALNVVLSCLMGAVARTEEEEPDEARAEGNAQPPQAVSTGPTSSSRPQP